MKDVHQKLLALFRVEHKEHLEGIRRALEASDRRGADRAGDGLEEAFRRAHSLKGAARAVNLAPIETLAHRVETVFSRIREGHLRLDPSVRKVLKGVLDAIEDWVAALSGPHAPEPPLQALESIDRLLGIEEELDRESALVAPVEVSPVETVRVAREALDRLLRSSSDLTVESLRTREIGSTLESLSRGIALLERAVQKARRQARQAIQARGRWNGDPALERLASALESIETESRRVVRETDSLRRAQRQSSWKIQAMGSRLQDDLREVRLIAAGNVLEGFGSIARDLARKEGKDVDVHLSGLEVRADRDILQGLKDPLIHLIRNAITHGIETREERLRAGKEPTGRIRILLRTESHRLLVSVEDDGRGIDFRRVADEAVRRSWLSESERESRSTAELTRYLFQPGFSTSSSLTRLAGRGMGLSIVAEAMARLQGTVEVDPGENRTGTRVLLSLPVSLSSVRLVLVRVQSETLALPSRAVEKLRLISPREARVLEGKPAVLEDGRPVPLARLSALLGWEADGEEAPHPLPVAILRAGEERSAVAVDAFVGELDGVIQNVRFDAPGNGKVAGGILLPDGSICLVLNPASLLAGLQALEESPFWVAAPAVPAATPTILVVDDSITTRALEKSILEAHGYPVRVAVDGVEALALLRSERVDLVIADIQMPRLDGFGLLEEMKKDARLSHIPVIIVTSMENATEQERGLSLGADAYIVKRKFDQRDLLDTIRQIL